MPASRIKAGTRIDELDALGYYAGVDATAIRHIGLADQAITVASVTAPMPGVHMGPPLSQNTRPAQFVAGADLKDAERKKIRIFVDEQLLENQAVRQRQKNSLRAALREYIIRPAFKRRTKAIACHRFSCAGFVQRAYQQARVRLVVDESQLPAVSLETIRDIYYHHAARLSRGPMRRAFGLEGDGPWQVLFPGYLIKSLERDRIEMLAGPYQPTDADIRFQPP